MNNESFISNMDNSTDTVTCVKCSASSWIILNRSMIVAMLNFLKKIQSKVVLNFENLFLPCVNHVDSHLAKYVFVGYLEPIVAYIKFWLNCLNVKNLNQIMTHVFSSRSSRNLWLNAFISKDVRWKCFPVYKTKVTWILNPIKYVWINLAFTRDLPLPV